MIDVLIADDVRLVYQISAAVPEDGPDTEVVGWAMPVDKAIASIWPYVM